MVHMARASTTSGNRPSRGVILKRVSHILLMSPYDTRSVRPNAKRQIAVVDVREIAQSKDCTDKKKERAMRIEVIEIDEKPRGDVCWNAPMTAETITPTRIEYVAVGMTDRPYLATTFS